MSTTLEAGNPFAKRSTLAYELPPFAEIGDDHYLPAFEAGVAEQLAEVDRILASGEPTFENTIEALERSGQLLNRMLLVFYNKASSDTNPKLDEIEAEIAPKLAAHSDAIRLNPELYARIHKLHSQREKLALDPESKHLLERYRLDFTLAGAALSSSEREALKLVNEAISRLETKFGQNLLADTNALAIEVADVALLEGLSEAEIASCKAAAEARSSSAPYLIAMVNYTGNPLLAKLKNRELRQRVMQASLVKGGRAGEHDNREILVQLAKLRAERAKILGAANHAEQTLKDCTAGNPAAVHRMLSQIAPAAVRNAKAEGAALTDVIRASGEDFQLASWDWDFYTEAVRKERYDLDMDLLKPYFELNRVLHDGVFFAARRLFGISFVPREDLATYHPQAKAFEVLGEDGKPVGLYIADFYARASKHGGAWMNNLVDQNYLLGQLPVVVNNLNIPEPPAGEPTLLTFDETKTLFHEFGHALHGLLSKLRYPRFSGTSTPRDFVEFPSQVNEMWMLWPEVLANYAKHHITGEPIPAEWVERIEASAAFNEGHATTAYLAASVLDLAWHSITEETSIESVEDFEAAAISSYGLDYAPVPTRYRSSYFSHIFAGGYSAGYYGYIWSEVLDADTVEWFKTSGGLTRENGRHFEQTLLSRGGSEDAMQLFRDFLGRDAVIEPLLRRRGLLSKQ